MIEVSLHERPEACVHTHFFSKDEPVVTRLKGQALCVRKEAPVWLHVCPLLLCRERAVLVVGRVINVIVVLAAHIGDNGLAVVRVPARAAAVVRKAPVRAVALHPAADVGHRVADGRAVEVTTQLAAHGAGIRASLVVVVVVVVRERDDGEQDERDEDRCGLAGKHS